MIRLVTSSQMPSFLIFFRLSRTGCSRAPIICRYVLSLNALRSIIPGINDDPQEIRDMASFVATELGINVSWHISRFYPAYKMKNVPPTPLNTLQKAKETGLDAGLNYVYIGNTSNTGDMNTKCPWCKSLLIERQGFGVTQNNIKNGHCPECGRKIAGEGMDRI